MHQNLTPKDNKQGYEGWTNEKIVAMLNEARALFGVLYSYLDRCDVLDTICDSFEDLMMSCTDHIHDTSCCMKHFMQGGCCEVEAHRDLIDDLSHARSAQDAEIKKLKGELQLKFAEKKAKLIEKHEAEKQKLIDKLWREKEEIIYQASKMHDGQTVLDKVKV